MKEKPLYKIAGISYSRKTTKCIEYVVSKAVKGKSVVYINCEERLEWIYEKFSDLINEKYPDSNDLLINVSVTDVELLIDKINEALETIENIDILVIDCNSDKFIDVFDKIRLDRNIEVVYTESVFRDKVVGRKPIAKKIKVKG